jgi:TIR domain
MKYDFFICHATEDKETVARPLAQEFAKRGYKVWYDEFVLNVGDSLRAEIDRGLVTSRFGVVILSPNFFGKHWTAYELSGLLQRALGDKRGLILPIWHEIDRDTLLQHAPSLADIVAVNTKDGTQHIVERLCTKIGGPTGYALEISPNQHQQMSDEEKCPQCGEQGEIFGYEGSDGDEACWFECRKCGFTEFYQ